MKRVIYIGAKYRKERNESLDYIEEQTGLVKSTLWKWEKNLVIPRIDALIILSTYWGIEWTDLIETIDDEKELEI